MSLVLLRNYNLHLSLSCGNSSTAIAISYQQQYPNGYQQQSLAVAGDYSKAINYYNKSLEFNKKIGNKLGEVASLTGLGDAYLKKGIMALLLGILVNL